MSLEEISSQQVSTIKPPQKPRPAPSFIFTDKSSTIDTYESFGKNGFAHLMLHQAEFRYEQEKKFISQVDLTKGPIYCSLQNIVRIQAPDLNSPKRERKEYMYYTVICEAKNHRNNVIRYTLEHEGKYSEQTKETRTVRDAKGLDAFGSYVKGVPRDIYTIPWDKKKAEDLIKNQKVFGEDTINTTHPQEVDCVVKFLTGNIGRTKFDMEDFLNFTYEKLQEASKTNESPYLQELRRKSRPYG